MIKSIAHTYKLTRIGMYNITVSRCLYISKVKVVIINSSTWSYPEKPNKTSHLHVDNN